jgi:Lrp/AsnC family transcriptional regulator, leucine-responsive regulatory protein
MVVIGVSDEQSSNNRADHGEFGAKVLGQTKQISSMSAAIEEIDRIDRKILDVLQREGRISNLKLAEAVALSPTAVLGRVQRLTRDGYIVGYEARLDPAKLGAGMLVFVEVLLDRTTPNVFEAFKAAVQVYPEIMECHMVAGGFDYLLKTRVADMHAYRHFAGTVLWQLPGVRETRTYAVMEEVKSSSRLALGV